MEYSKVSLDIVNEFVSICISTTINSEIFFFYTSADCQILLFCLFTLKLQLHTWHIVNALPFIHEFNLFLGTTRCWQPINNKTSSGFLRLSLPLLTSWMVPLLNLSTGFCGHQQQRVKRNCSHLLNGLSIFKYLVGHISMTKYCTVSKECPRYI